MMAKTLLERELELWRETTDRFCGPPWLHRPVFVVGLLIYVLWLIFVFVAGLLCNIALLVMAIAAVARFLQDGRVTMEGVVLMVFVATCAADLLRQQQTHYHGTTAGETIARSVMIWFGLLLVAHEWFFFAHEWFFFIKKAEAFVTYVYVSTVILVVWSVIVGLLYYHYPQSMPPTPREKEQETVV